MEKQTEMSKDSTLWLSFWVKYNLMNKQKTVTIEKRTNVLAKAEKSLWSSYRNRKPPKAPTDGMYFLLWASERILSVL